MVGYNQRKYLERMMQLRFDMGEGTDMHSNDIVSPLSAASRWQRRGENRPWRSTGGAEVTRKGEQHFQNQRVLNAFSTTTTRKEEQTI
jgi:hypothetical protein